LEFSPQIINAGFIALSFTGNQDCLENFELLQQQWQSNMNHLKILVNECLESEMFIKVSESLILREAQRVQTHVQLCDSSAILASNNIIVCLTNRIVETAQQEVDNSEDDQYKSDIYAVNQCLIHGKKIILWRNFMNIIKID
jgi:hypothetical protein